jgi:large subunit ribosomal protein L22
MKKKQVTVYAKWKNARISPKKVAPVMNLVRGKSVRDAKIALHFDTTKAAAMILKTLVSAEANAKNNESLKSSELYVADIRVDGGRVFKRGRIVAKSRFSPILKRTSHIIVGISEKNDGGVDKK